MSSDGNLESGHDRHHGVLDPGAIQRSSTAVIDNPATLDWQSSRFGGQPNGRLVAALEEFLEGLRTGTAPSRQEFLERYPEIAESLGQCLSGLELVHAAGCSLGLGDSRLVPAGLEAAGLATAAQLGDYRIVRELGRGSMGVVYEAEQISLGRRVALKVLPLISAIDPRQRQRFLIEAQAAAQLHHPHIVPVFAAGCEHGVHYYAMRYVDGHSLAELNGSFRGGMTGIARLGIQAAEALEHAHHLGVVHRDIKPANLLVDSQGELWVADFGLAYFRSDVSLTLSGDLVGTLRYMSPEQALARRGVVDQRTDIYALGLTLYELLTHRPAFDGRDHQELLRQIAQDEPPPPRRVNPAIPRDLETIILKATCKEPAGRYNTAQELANDLSRFCNDLPILARRPRLLERAVRWARRRRQIVIAALAALLLAMSAGAAVFWVQASKTEALRRRQHEYILTSFPAIDMITMTAMQKVIEASMGPGPDIKRAQMAELYKKALAFYVQASELPPTDLASRTIRARAQFRMGFTHAVMGGVFGGPLGYGRPDMVMADASYRAAISRFEALTQEAPDNTDVRRYFADALGEWGLGWFLGMTQSPAASESSYRRALALRRALILDPKVDLDVVSEELVEHVQLARKLAAILESHGQPGRGAEVRQDLVTVCQMLAHRPRDVEWHRKLARPLGMKGSALVVEDQRAEGVELLRLALRIYPQGSRFLNNLAWALVIDPAVPPFEPYEALETIRRAVDMEPNNWGLWNTMGVAAYRMGDWKTAAEALETSMSLHDGGEASDWFFMAMVCWRRNQRAEARKWFDQATEWTGKNQPQNHELRRFQAEARALLQLPEPPSHEPTPAEARQAAPKPPGRSA